MFDRIYLEITNVCNRSCAFCPGTRREARFLRLEEFRTLAGKLRPFGKTLYLHVMGEPLLHPQLPELLAIAGELDFRVNITTNGTLLPQAQEVLLNAPALQKVHISLHSFEANDRDGLDTYLDGCTAFGLLAQEKDILVDYRLWNLDGQDTQGLHGQNGAILAKLHEAFGPEFQEQDWGARITDKIYLHYAERFVWPDLSAEDHGPEGSCLALRQQLAVLCDGSVVPCCLDHEGDAVLGNLFSQELADILASAPAQQMLEGFRNRKHLHPLCRRCGYARRFG